MLIQDSTACNHNTLIKKKKKLEHSELEGTLETMCGSAKVPGFRVSTLVLLVGTAAAADSDSHLPRPPPNGEGNNNTGSFQGLQSCKIANP